MNSSRMRFWGAWALSKTGGKLIPIEIDAGLHRKALQNFKAAGVEAFIDARRADAHQLVRELKGPFDFVFLDADKEWYTQYFKDLDPKLVNGGCFTAHNAATPSRELASSWISSAVVRTTRPPSTAPAAPASRSVTSDEAAGVFRFFDRTSILNTKKKPATIGSGLQALMFKMEAASGFEPENSGFADHCLPTWLCRQKKWSGKRDLNPRLRPWQGRTLPLSYSRSTELKLLTTSAFFVNPKTAIKPVF
jgi:hypothetical protein